MQPIPGHFLLLPYCIRSLGESRYAVLNRDYKPLGLPNDRHYDYAQHALVIPRFTSVRQRKLDWMGRVFEETPDGTLFLYQATPDITDPVYLLRLQSLCAMRMYAEIQK